MTRKKETAADLVNRALKITRSGPADDPERSQKALVLFQRAGQLEPDNFFVLFMTALMHLNVQEYQEAADLMDRCIAMQPDQYIGYALKGAVLNGYVSDLMKEDMPEEEKTQAVRENSLHAAVMFGEAMRNCPRDHALYPWFQMQYAESLMIDERGLAKRYFQGALSVSSKFAHVAHTRLMQIYDHEGDRASAAHHAQMLTQLGEHRDAEGFASLMEVIFQAERSKLPGFERL